MTQEPPRQRSEQDRSLRLRPASSDQFHERYQLDSYGDRTLDCGPGTERLCVERQHPAIARGRSGPGTLRDRAQLETTRQRGGASSLLYDGATTPRATIRSASARPDTRAASSASPAPASGSDSAAGSAPSPPPYAGNMAIAAAQVTAAAACGKIAMQRIRQASCCAKGCWRPLWLTARRTHRAETMRLPATTCRRGAQTSRCGRRP